MDGMEHFFQQNNKIKRIHDRFNLPTISQSVCSVFTKNVLDILYLSNTPYAFCNTGPQGMRSRDKIQTDSMCEINCITKFEHTQNMNDLFTYPCVRLDQLMNYMTIQRHMNHNQFPEHVKLSHN